MSVPSNPDTVMREAVAATRRELSWAASPASPEFQ